MGVFVVLIVDGQDVNRIIKYVIVRMGVFHPSLLFIIYNCKLEMKQNFIDIITETVIRNIKEAHYRNVGDEIEPFTGRRPKSIKARINQIYKLTNKYGLSSRKYHDDHWLALNDYDKVISSMGCEFTYWCENGGYTDRDQDGRPMSKVYNVEISYDDGMIIGGYIKMMAAGSMEDPFDAYDTCMVLWPKSSVRE